MLIGEKSIALAKMHRAKRKAPSALSARSLQNTAIMMPVYAFNSPEAST